MIDTRTGGAFRIYKYEDYNSLEELKRLLKILNVNYGVDIEKDEKISTKDINNKALLKHIEYIFKLAGNNSISLKVVEDEWSYLINYYK